MTIPSFVLGIILATLAGLLFHLWKGGSLLKMIYYVLLSVIGFWSGHYLATYYDWSFGKLGTLYAGSAIIFSTLFLIVGHWLSLVEVKTKNL